MALCLPSLPAAGDNIGASSDPIGSTGGGNCRSQHTRYYPPSTSASSKRRRPYIKKCFCQSCKQQALASTPSRPSRAEKSRGAFGSHRAPKHVAEREDFYALACSGDALPGDFRVSVNNSRQIRRRGANQLHQQRQGSSGEELRGRGGSGCQSQQQSRPPSLTRETAFRDPSTSRSNSVSRRDIDRRCSTDSLEEEAQVAELYRLGILYDDEQERGAGFGLASIERQEQPVYAIRPAKRRRAGARQLAKEGKRGEMMTGLRLDLSFSDLGGDEEIARMLGGDYTFDTVSEDGSSTMMMVDQDRDDDEAQIQLQYQNRTQGQGTGHARNESIWSTTTTTSMPITVIYEVDEDAAADDVPDEGDVPDMALPSSQETIDDDDDDDEDGPGLRRTQGGGEEDEDVEMESDEETWILLPNGADDS